MLNEALDFITSYIDLLNQSFRTIGGQLSKTQRIWLAFCLTAMIFTNTISWKAWERWSAGKYSDSALSKMFRKSFILVAESITFPVGFAFYEPDPELKKWQKNEEELKKQKVKKKIAHQNLIKIIIIQQNYK